MKRLLNAVFGPALGAPVGFALALVLTPPAQAQQLQTIAHSSAVGGGGGDIRDSHVDPLVVPPAVTELVTDAGGVAQVRMQAGYGRVSGHVNALEPVGVGGFVAASGNAIFQDAVTLIDPGRALGDPIDLMFTMKVDAGDTVNPDPVSFLPMAGYCDYDCGYPYVNVSLCAADCSLGGNYVWSPSQHDPDTQVFTLHARVGQQIGFSFQLALEAYLHGAEGHNQVDIDFTPGASLTLSTDSPTATLQSLSGHDYGVAAAVPAPSSAAMLAAGLLAVGWLAARRGR
jgi:hypothetical protein